MGINSTHRTNTETKTHINEKSIRLAVSRSHGDFECNLRITLSGKKDAHFRDLTKSLRSQ